MEQELKHREIKIGLMLSEYRRIFLGTTKWLLIMSSCVTGALYAASILLPKPFGGAALLFFFLWVWMPAVIVLSPFMCRVLLPFVIGLLEALRIMLWAIQFLVVS